MLGRVRCLVSFPRSYLLFYCGLLIALMLFRSASLAHDLPLLTLGVSYNQQVQNGQKYVYLLPLTAGQYCRLDINARMVIVRISTPARQKLLEKHANQFFGDQSRIDLIAETSGNYVVELFQFSRQVDGGYTFKLTEARPALEKDSLRLQARRLMDEVEALDLAFQPRAVYRQLIPKLESALALWQASGDVYGEADCLFALGECSFGSEPLEEAVRYFNAALALYRQVGAREEEALVLYELARHYRNLHLNRTAQEYFQQALALRHQLNQPQAVGDTLITLARLHQVLGELPKALELHHEAAQIFRATANRSGLATALENLGEVSRALGEQHRALSYYEEAMALRSVAGSWKGVGVALNEIAKAYFELGDYQRARDIAIKAIASLREQGDTIEHARAFATLGRAYLALREYPKAVKSLRQAIADHTFRAQNPSLLAADCNFLCEAYAAQGEYDQASDACRQAQSLSEKAAYLPYSSITQGLLATIAWRRGDFTQACTHFETAIKQVESLRSKATLSAHRAALLGSKQHLYADYIKLLMELHQHLPTQGFVQQALRISERARARSLLEALIESRTDIRQGVEPALLAEEKNLQQQLNAKAAELTPVFSGKQTEGQVTALNNTIAGLTLAYEQVQAKIRQHSPRYAALTQPQPLTASTIQKQVVDNNMLLLEYALGEEQSFLFTLTGDSVNSYELPKRAIIEQAARRVHDLLTERNRRPPNLPKFEAEPPADRQARLAKADAEFKLAAAELSRLILAPAAAELKNRHLLIVADGALQMIPFAALPEPAGQVASEQRLGAGTKRRSPAVSPQPLIVKHAITYLPSASVLGVLRQETKDRPPAPKTLAIFADPVFDADDPRVPVEVRERLAREHQTPATDKATELAAPVDELTRAIKDVGLDGERGGLGRLPYTNAEAAAILKLAPAGQNFSALGFDATQDMALKAELSQYRYLHFATHGLIDNTNPELSGMVLSLLDAQGRSIDGHLRMVEIYNMHLPAELVVLSACKTGLGKDVRGEGLMSLTRGFMYAGAKRVMVSLWDVNDKSTASLMSEFYRRLLSTKTKTKPSPAQALRAAQLWMLKQPQWQAPYYWAAFVQHGEPLGESK